MVNGRTSSKWPQRDIDQLTLRLRDQAREIANLSDRLAVVTRDYRHTATLLWEKLAEGTAPTADQGGDQGGDGAPVECVIVRERCPACSRLSDIAVYGTFLRCRTCQATFTDSDLKR